jgi:hypothetical protein
MLKGFNPKEIKANAAEIIKAGAALYDALGQVKCRIWLSGGMPCGQHALVPRSSLDYRHVPHALVLTCCTLSTGGRAA